MITNCLYQGWCRLTIGPSPLIHDDLEALSAIRMNQLKIVRAEGNHFPTIWRRGALPDIHQVSPDDPGRWLATPAVLLVLCRNGNLPAVSFALRDDQGKVFGKLHVGITFRVVSHDHLAREFRSALLWSPEGRAISHFPARLGKIHRPQPWTQSGATGQKYRYCNEKERANHWGVGAGPGPAGLPAPEPSILRDISIPSCCMVAC